ncbi:AbrB/MazE/SpoVT family DNA-binding domain-containing protein [Candidatus Woesearchaeota archaeon]|nr:AbrB/MazE/SpoVT family DNA-binding domain-containing protein [Candidatus Woesearchaeota archaeon]
MNRKVNLVGKNTLTVSLPNKWAKRLDIKKGDELKAIEENNCLILSTEEVNRIKKADIYVKKPKRLVTRSLFNLYRKGVDEIKIKFDEAEVIKDIQKSMSLLMGFEISDQGKNFITLKSVMKIDSEEFNNTFRRLFLVTKSLAEDSYEAIKNKRYEELDGISELEAIQNRYYMFCCRVINVKDKAMFEFPTLMYLLTQRLEDIADDYKYICRYIIEDKINTKISEPVLKLYKRINEKFNLLYELYYKYDIEHAKKIALHKNELIKEGLELLEKVPKKEIRIVHILNNLTVKIFEASSPIIGMNVEK